jgi:hypothetical protein
MRYSVGKRSLFSGVEKLSDSHSFTTTLIEVSILLSSRFNSKQYGRRTGYPLGTRATKSRSQKCQNLGMT